jgi:hypothetical protein
VTKNLKRFFEERESLAFKGISEFAPPSEGVKIIGLFD